MWSCPKHCLGTALGLTLHRAVPEGQEHIWRVRGMNRKGGRCSLPAGPGARERSQSCLTCCSRNSLSLHGCGKGLDKFIGEKSIKKAFLKKKQPSPASQIAGHEQGNNLHALTPSPCFSISICASGRSTGLTGGTLLPGRGILAAGCWSQPNLCFPKPACRQCPPAVFPTKPTYGGRQADTSCW